MNNVTQPPGAIRAAFCRGVSGKGARTRRLKSCDCYSFDGDGNVAALASAANGNVTAQYGYGPFGEVIRQTGPMAKVNPIRFSTKYQDDESDLLYYGYRYYKASTGTWVSRDPSGEKNGKNLYGFAENNAPNKFDTLGLLVGKVWFQQYYPYMNTSLFWAERGIKVFLLWSPPDSWGDKPCCRCMAAVWMQYKMDGTIDIPMNDDESTGAWYCDAPTKPAILTDQPHVGNVSYWALKPLSPYTWNFKSVLMCNEGKDVGKVYATVYWGGTYTYDSMPVTFPPIIQ